MTLNWKRLLSSTRQGKVTWLTLSSCDNVIAAQYTDGGWSTTQDTPYNTNWHPSISALMILLYVEYPATTYSPMLAAAPS